MLQDCISHLTVSMNIARQPLLLEKLHSFIFKWTPSVIHTTTLEKKANLMFSRDGLYFNENTL